MGFPFHDKSRAHDTEYQERDAEVKGLDHCDTGGSSDQSIDQSRQEVKTN